MRTEKFHRFQCSRAADAGGFYKINRIPNTVYNVLISRPVGAATHKPEIPMLRMMQIRKTTIHQCTGIIQSGGRMMISFNQPLRISIPGIFLDSVNDIAAITWQILAVYNLSIAAPGLSELAGHAADTNDWYPCAPSEHE